MFTFEKKIKKEKLFQMDLNSDLKKEPDLKSRQYLQYFDQ